MVTIILMGQLQTDDGERDLACEVSEPVSVSQLIRRQPRLRQHVGQLMKEKKLNDVLLTGGGIIPDKDTKKLNEMGVGKLFGPGTTTGEIIEYIKSATRGRRKEEAIF